MTGTVGTVPAPVAPLAFDLTGRTAVVTGARRGIGAAIAAALLDHGATVVVCGRDAAQVDAQVEQLGRRGRGKPVGCVGDLTTQAGREQLLRTAGAVDILVNNAGGFTRPVTALQSTADEWDEQIALNLTVPFLLCQAVLPGMVQRRWGRIINIGSVVATAPQPDNAIGYVAAKSGLVGFTRQLAVEVARYGVTANVVNPGTVATEHLLDYFAAADEGVGEESLSSRIPVGRLGRPDEIAAVVPFLASDAGAFTTGAVIDINGGAVTA
ncbi:SDR family NAD(P)-dependent oxidoreductase [Streptomyces sp. NPDC002088]|uniref:SDR family NAD(P)-dependent oxidoreductase n=1 Tax=Streptomyces sp. NPDC002088 TaxID=3154665 RepID=UPI00332AB8B4